jgi:hypothetical protein
MEFGVLTAFMQAIMSSGFMPHPLAQVRNGVRNIVMNKIPYLINEMPQDALKRPSRMDGIFFGQQWMKLGVGRRMTNYSQPHE